MTEANDDPDSSRRSEGIAAYACQFGLSEQETGPFMEKMLGSAMAEEAQYAAAAAWREGALDRRDRSLLVIASLIAQGGLDARLRGHLRWSGKNGVTFAELEELMTLLAVYVGYPKASSAMDILREELSAETEA